MTCGPRTGCEGKAVFRRLKRQRTAKGSVSSVISVLTGGSRGTGFPPAPWWEKRTVGMVRKSPASHQPPWGPWGVWLKWTPSVLEHYKPYLALKSCMLSNFRSLNVTCLSQKTKPSKVSQELWRWDPTFPASDSRLQALLQHCLRGCAPQSPTGCPELRTAARGHWRSCRGRCF